MFDRIVVRPHNLHNDKDPLDVGAVVEALLFYCNTELAFNPGVVNQLARLWTPAGLVELAEEGLVQLNYSSNFYGIQTDQTGTNRERYRPVVFSVHPHEGGPPRGLDDFVPRIFEEITGRRGQSRRLSQRLYRHITSSPISDTLPERVEADLLDIEFLRPTVLRLMHALVPEYSMPREARFEVQRIDDRLRVLTTIDFPLVNELVGARFGKMHSQLSPATLLAHVMRARETLEAGARFDADMAVDAAVNAVASQRIETSMSRTRQSQRQLEAFQAFVFDDGRAIREAINNGSKDFREVLALLKSARKFREWIAGIPHDSEIAKEYLRACTRETWAERLPSKSLKWAMFSGAGIFLDALGLGGLGTAAGVGLSAIDGFILDPLLRGWRPSQFVEQRLRPFIESD